MVISQHILGVLSRPKVSGSFRNQSVVAGPPTYKLGFAERMIFGVGNVLCMLIIPVWAICNIPAWRERAKGKPSEGA